MWFTTLLKVLLRAAPLLAVGLAIRPLTFHPSPGSTLTKCLANEWRVHLDELEIVINDVRWWTGYTADSELSQRIVVSDTFLALQGGRPTALDRTFETISQKLGVSMGASGRYHLRESVSGRSALEGTTVQFRLEGNAYTAQFAPLDRGLDDALLDGLDEDMDLRVLLPTDTVRVDDRWTIDLESLPDLLSPGGYFAWTLESSGAVPSFSRSLDPSLMGELRLLLGGMLEGQATVTYAAQEGGIAQLDLSIDVEATSGLDELSEFAEKIVAEFSDWGAVEVERMDLVFSLNATGTAKWDTERGLLMGLVLEGDVDSTLDLAVIWNLGSMHSIEVRAETHGDFEQSFDTR